MTSSSAGEGTTAPPTGWPGRELDVRPLLASGNEPFGAIMAAVDELAAREVLALRTPFDPQPLHRVLGARGFLRATEQVGPAEFVTRYWRPEEDTAVVLDVRGLEPPEPMERTLAALDRLPPGGELLQINERVPVFLLEILDDRGDAYRIEEDDRGTLVTIRRADA